MNDIVKSALIERAGNAQTLDEAFPTADPGWEPYGDRVLVQLRSPKKKTESGLIVPSESRDQEKWMTTVAKVVALGPLAFRDRKTREPWPEGVWAKVGDYVRCPKWGGDRWEIALKEEWNTEEVARFAVFRDHELIAGLKSGDNPLRFRDYI